MIALTSTLRASVRAPRDASPLHAPRPLVYDALVNTRRLLLTALALGLVSSGCDASGTLPPGDGGGGGMDTGIIPADGGGGLDAGTTPRPDAGAFDPFDPDSSCGSSAIPTERVPGSLLLVFDRSGSMASTPGGDDASSSDPSKWDLAGDAINAALGSTSDDLGAGLMLFPTGEGSECDVVLSSGVPQVAVAPLATSRAEITSALATADPGGGVTPIFDALRAGYDYLDTLDTIGQRGVVLVTDGAENCDQEDQDAVYAQASSELADNNYLTFVVGLTTSNSVLSTLAYNGGTPRNDTCLPECTTPLCTSDADCPGAGTCTTFIAGFPGFCGCATDADCPDPLTCESVPFLGSQCSGDANCCHYDASEGSFSSDFEMALDDIASRFLDSCVFDLPRGADPSTFDPALVNVGVTFEGEERTVLRRSSDPSGDSWNYTTPDNRSIIIQGPICDRLLTGAADVEIVLGCATILI